MRSATVKGCNFVVPRFYRGKIADFSKNKALSIYRRLLENEYGAYWTFLYFTGEQYFIGATPERHLQCERAASKMNPISTAHSARWNMNKMPLSGR